MNYEKIYENIIKLGVKSKAYTFMKVEALISVSDFKDENGYNQKLADDIIERMIVKGLLKKLEIRGNPLFGTNELGAVEGYEYQLTEKAIEQYAEVIKQIEIGHEYRFIYSNAKKTIYTIKERDKELIKLNINSPRLIIFQSAYELKTKEILISSVLEKVEKYTSRDIQKLKKAINNFNDDLSKKVKKENSLFLKKDEKILSISGNSIIISDFIKIEK